MQRRNLWSAGTNGGSGARHPGFIDVPVAPCFPNRFRKSMQVIAIDGRHVGSKGHHSAFTTLITEFGWI